MSTELMPPGLGGVAVFNGQACINLKAATKWPTNQVTVCVWVRWVQPTPGENYTPSALSATILNYGEDPEGEDNSRRFWINGLDLVNVHWSGSSVQFPPYIADGHWHHVAVSMNPISSTQYQVTLYIDGWMNEPKTISHGTAEVLKSGLSLNLGTRLLEFSEETFSGEMCLFSVWNTVRQQSEIQAEMTLGVDEHDPDLAYYWSLNSAPSGANVYNVTFKPMYRAKVEFILDGRAYFTKLKELLVRLKNSAHPNYPMPVPAPPTFGELVVQAGAEGQKVDLIIWGWDRLSSLYQIGRDLKAYALNNGKDVSPTYRQTKQQFDQRASEHKGNVRVFIEDYYTQSAMYYAGTTASSQHEKIAIFSFNGEKYALVGGFNIETRCWDDPTHPMYDPNTLHTWHDTAIFLQGEGVSTIEQEFDRRWAKIKSTYPPLSANLANYAKIACWSIEYDACLDHDVCFGQPPKDPGYVTTDPTATLNATQNISVEALITNAESQTAIIQIEDALIQQIGLASHYIFFENYTFHSPKLIKALGDRLNQVSSLNLIIMTPEYNPSDDLEKAESFFTRCAFLALAIPYTDQVMTVFGDIWMRSKAQTWRVDLDMSAIERSTFSYKDSGSSLRTVSLDQILGFGNLTRQFYFCAPYRRVDGSLKRIYPHSKLAFFDDDYLILGSANFSKRSMEDDGELSLRVRGTDVVRNIRTQLFTHWNMDTPDNWQTKMDAFAQSTTNRVGVLPLDVKEMYHTWPDGKWYYLSFLVPTSQYAK